MTEPLTSVGPDPSSDTAAASTSAIKPESTSKVPPSWLWLREHDQMFLTVCVTAFLVLSGYHWATLSGWGAVPLEVDRLPARRYDYRIDINSASWVEWTQIEGIGEVTANKIIADREAHGAFKTIDDLLRVKGIGPKTLEKMRPFLRDVGDATASSTGRSSNNSPPQTQHQL